MTELTQPRRKRDDLQALIEKSVAEFNALPEAEQREIRRQQRESWVRGEMGLMEHYHND